MEKISTTDAINALITKVETCMNDEKGLVCGNDSAKNFLSNAVIKLRAAYDLISEKESLDSFNYDEFKTKLQEINIDTRVFANNNNQDEVKREVTKNSEDFYNSVKKFTDSLLSSAPSENTAKEKKQQIKKKFLIVGIIGEVLELIVSVISTFIDANWFGWAVVGVRATQIICLFLSLFSVIAFCFDVILDPKNGNKPYKIIFYVNKADHTKLIFISFMLITLLIGAILTTFILKGLPLFAPLILLGFAAIVFISFLVTIKITKNTQQTMSKNDFKLINKIINITLIILFFAVVILGGVYVVKPQYLYGTSTITYKIDDVTHSKSVVYGKEYSIEVPKKVGYTFLGLYDKEENGIQYIDAKGDCIKPWDSKIRNENKELFAQWKINTYTFIYDIKGGECQDLKNFECDYEANLPTLASNVSKRGYTFLGWTTSDAKLLSDCNGILVPGRKKLIFPVYDIPTVEKTIDLHAKWQGNKYDVTLDVNGGNPIIKTNTSVTFGDNCYFGVATKLGYSFVGWCDNIKLDNLITYIDGKTIYPWNYTNTITLYAKWQANTNEIIFYGNGATNGIMENQPIKTDETKNLIPNLFTRVGYTFMGWATSTTSTVATYIDGANYKMATGDVALYAVWMAKTYDITFDINGGVGEIAKVTATYDSAMPTLSSSAPTKTGYKFDGFYDKATGGVKYYNANLTSAKTFDKTVATTLYAVWTADDNTLTFDKNGGNGTMQSQIIKTDAMAKLTTNSFTRTGYTFAGWTTTADGDVNFFDGAD